MLQKAMTEAEHSIAVKRRMTLTKHGDHDNSPGEVYSPKRKSSDHCHTEASPPLYIPSKKESINQSNSCGCCNGGRHIPSRDDCRELISKFRREELFRMINLDLDSTYRSEYIKSHKKDRRLQGRKTNFSSKREVKSDNSSSGVNNFQITTHVVSSKLPSTSDKYYNRVHHQSPSPEQTVLVTVNPVINMSSRIPVTARLGKVVSERKKSTDGRESINSRIRYSKSSTEHNDTDLSNKERHSEFKNSKLTLSCGQGVSSVNMKIVQPQYKIAYKHSTKKMKTHFTSDCKVTHADTEKKGEDYVVKDSTSDDNIATAIYKCNPSNNMSNFSGLGVSDNETEDLSTMIDEDLDTDQFNNTQNDIILDLEGDNDISKVMGGTENRTLDSDMKKYESNDQRSSTKFIVTLDGVDETQFVSKDSSNVVERFKDFLSAPVATYNTEQQNLVLTVLSAQDRTKSETHLQQMQALSPSAVFSSKLTTSQIQTSSMESNNNKEGRSATRCDYYHNIENAVEEEDEISPIKRAKLSERCRFWPACAAGSSCEYHHPTAHCKLFPNCKFGDKCLFIHPNCRFDSKCMRPDCTYTHTSRRPSFCGSSHLIAVPKPQFLFSPFPQKLHTGRPRYHNSQTMCHYFPNCQNGNCPFLHPKPCRFGLACKSSACLFSHPPVFGKNTLKWRSDNNNPQARLPTLLTSVKMQHIVPRIPCPAKFSHSTTVSSTSQ